MLQFLATPMLDLWHRASDRTLSGHFDTLLYNGFYYFLRLEFFLTLDFRQYYNITIILRANMVCESSMKTKICYHYGVGKDLNRVKTGFKSVPLQIYFEITGLASAEKWCEIQNTAGEEHF